MISRWDPVYLSYLKQTKFTFKFPTQILRKVASSFSGGTPSKEHLRVMRRRLITRIKSRVNNVQISTENIVSIVHGLLSRSILIKYLEERKDYV